MDITEATLQVNKFARRMRHLRNFSKTTLVLREVYSLLGSVISPLKGVFRSSVFIKTGHALSVATHLISEVLPVSPQRRLLFQAAIVSGVALIVSTVSPAANFMSNSVEFSAEYIEAYAVSGNILVSDEDGYLVKVNPQTDEASRIGMTDYAVHTIESGETLSAIAAKYGVKVETIMWENNIGNANSVRIGQTLLIPPVNGISYKVTNGDTLDKIAKKYNVPAEKIIAQNNIVDNVIQKGQTLFLPDARPIVPANPVVIGRNGAVTRNDRAYVNAQPSTAVPAAGKAFIFPTKGKISQGYRGGHYALDIADRSKPPIWAAGGGTVEKVSTGTWGGGYGNHVIVNHGDGVKTLYAHMDTVNVYEGQSVGQGDVLGIMGNTGRVYGATGIHLHWEVWVNGVKQNPLNWYSN